MILSQNQHKQNNWEEIRKYKTGPISQLIDISDLKVLQLPTSLWYLQWPYKNTALEEEEQHIAPASVYTLSRMQSMERVFEGLSMGCKMQTCYNVS